jgi:hypothetical protein
MIGLDFLLSKIPLRMPALEVPARVRPVQRVQLVQDAMGTVLGVPKATAPAANASLIDHALFALKHEDMNLAVLHEASKLIDAWDLVDALHKQPKGMYLRKLAFIWEKANQRELPLDVHVPNGSYVHMFDPETHHTGTNWESDSKFRVHFNGIGPYEFCPVVKKNPDMDERGIRTLSRLRSWAQDAKNQAIIDRVMDWSYLSETKSSYAIEGEVPSSNKEHAFRRALESLRHQPDLTEEYLVELQNMVISNPMDQEQQFRTRQNWLQRGGRGSSAVTYVPPEPEQMLKLMDAFMRMANESRGDVPPIIKAAMVSFGFTFIHPFEDGNGRISRLLAHHSLCRQGAIPMAGSNPAILPLSMSMKASESTYLDALTSFSKPARKMWDVKAISEVDFAFDFQSSPMIYAHWTGQKAAEFLTDCAENALENFLMNETEFIVAYDEAFRVINRKFNLKSKTVNLLIHWIRQNDGKMPNRRKNSESLLSLGDHKDPTSSFHGAIKEIESIVAEEFGPQLAKMAKHRPFD